MQFIKRWWTTIIGILVLSIPGFLKKDVYLVDVICSVVATVFFSVSICFDENWQLKEEFKINHKEKLEKIQSILFVSVLLFSTLIGYLFKIKGLILFYAHKNGYGIGIVPILASFFIVGVFTLFYRLRLKKNSRGKYNENI